MRNAHGAAHSPPARFDDAGFARLLADVTGRSDEFRQQRHISRDVIAALQDIGLYRAFVPERFGGIGMTVADFLWRIEQLAAADGSVGWVASFAFATKYLSSLPVATLAAIYAASPDVVFAGAVYPPQPARQVEGGVRVTGRWSFGSGCMGASLIGAGIRIAGRDGSSLPLMAVMPAEKVRIDPVWDTIGMTGTGSHDLIVDDVFVPDDWILVRGAPPTISTPAYRYPTLGLSAQVLAVCNLGVARAAIDHILGIAHKSQSITGAPTLGDRANVQIHLAECEAKLRSARSWFYEISEHVWAKVVAEQDLTRQDQMQLRLASSHVARTGADVARACFEMAGTAGIFTANPLSALSHRCAGDGPTCLSGRRLVSQRRYGDGRPSADSWLCVIGDLLHSGRGIDMNDQPRKIRTLFCIAVLQNFFDLPSADIGKVWGAFGQMLGRISTMEGVVVLGMLDDDETLVGTSPDGYPWTAYIMADMPDRDSVVAACNLFRTIEVGEYRLWKYCRVEARMGRALQVPAEFAGQ